MADAATEQPTEAVKPTETNGTEKKTTEEKATNGASDDKAAESKSEKPSNDDDRGEPDEFGRDKRGGKRDRSNDRYDRRDRNDRDRRGGRGGRGGRGRGGRGGRGGGYHNDRRNNVRTHFTREEESSDAQEIRRQVEFYFSDSNLPIDKFLLEETGGSENKPFPLKTIHNFKRMRHFQPFSAIVEAVKGSDFLEVNDKDEVYRKEPLDEKFTLDVQQNQELLTTKSMKNSIYAKGFGEENRTTAFDIEEFFQPYGAISVRLRRHDDKTFKGSVFVEFSDEDSAKQFLEMEEKPKFNDKELEIMSKQAYVDMKSQAILEGKVKPKSPTRKGPYRGGRDRRGSFNGNYKRKRDYDEDDDVGGDNWRERRDKFQKSQRGRGRDRDGGRRGRDESRSASRSRSRSPYREAKNEDKAEEKSEEKKDATEEQKPAEATEGAKAEVEA